MDLAELEKQVEILERQLNEARMAAIASSPRVNYIQGQLDYVLVNIKALKDKEVKSD